MSTQPGGTVPTLARPVPLSAAQETQVRELYHSNVRAYCAKEIKEFADCARGRTISATWKCREQQKAMNGCMVLHATPEEFDKAREQWFKQRLEKKRQMEEEQAKAAAGSR